MSDAQPVVNASDVARDRLIHIATTKLAALKVWTEVDPDGPVLRGELNFKLGKVLDPTYGTAISRATFCVVGYDHLQLVEPPLSALPPIEFYSLDQLSALEERIAEAVRARMALLHDLSVKMEGLRIRTVLDPTTLLLVGTIQAAQHSFEVQGTPGGVFVSSVSLSRGVPLVLAAPFPLRLEEYPAAIDLELHLVDAIPQMLRKPANAPAAIGPAEAPSEPHLMPLPPRADQLPLSAFAQRFPGAALSPESRVVLVQEFELAGATYRFRATYERGTSFTGRLIGPVGEFPAQTYELEGFLGVEQVVAIALRAPLSKPAEAEPEVPTTLVAAPVSAPGLPEHMVPHPGEVWVMNVLVEQLSEIEVRYTCLNVYGKPFGAARVLKRPDFEAIFSQERGCWRLAIIIEAVDSEGVLYRQLDGQRQPRGTQKKVSTGTIVENFVPEAAAY